MELSNPRRLAALERAALMDTPPEECFDRLTRLASQVLGTPVALVSLVDDRRQFFKSQLGLNEPWASRRETPLSHSFCQHVVKDQAVLNVEDAREHPTLKDNLAIPDLGVVAYLGVPLTASDGCPLGSFCVIDSSPRRWTTDQEAIMHELARSTVTEIELRTLNADLRQLNAEKNQLLGMAAHDLRTPLSAIVGYTAVVLHSSRLGPLGEEQRTLLERSAKAARYMLDLINNLLDVAKIESGALQLQTTDCCLSELVSEALELIRILAHEKSIQIDWQDQPGPSLSCDRQKLQQVVLNLLGNAVKFSPPGTHIVVQSDGHTLAVTDQGPGIPEQELCRLFQPFGKTSVRPTGGESSSGLGLAICRRIIEAHGGILEVDSCVGQGSTFRFRLKTGDPSLP